MSAIRDSVPSFRSSADFWLRSGMEGVVLLMVVVSPWFYGSVDPVFEYALYACIALLAILWGARSILGQEFVWFSCPVALSIAFIFILGVIQLIPLPSLGLTLLSTTAAAWNREFRPQQPEVLLPGETPASTAGLTPISLNPEATRQELFRWLALLVLFAAVRTNIASTASLKRLAWLALFNGILLSLFAMFQFFGSPARTVYGRPTTGEAFGPFIGRNNFADYICPCIGLAIGLLLISSRSEGDKRARRTHKANALVEQTAEDETTISLLSILHSPWQLWLSAGVAIMIAALICSMSRGGVAALVVAAILAVSLRGASRHGTRLELIAVPILLVAGLVAWLGINPLESRLATLWRGGLFGDGRVQIWQNLLPLTYRFPVFGSGYGTLPYVEPLNRQFDYPGYNATLVIDHAHNDYLEALIEGGVPRLAATLFGVYFLIRFARRAMRMHETRTPGRLALGALIGVAAVAAHSFVDFGMNTPAVACIVAVVAAQLASMARSDPTEPPTREAKQSLVIGLNGWGGVAGAAGLTVVAILLVARGDEMTFVQQRRMMAFAAMQKTPHLPRAIENLRQAVVRSPGDPNLRAELGQLYLDAGRLPAHRFAEMARPVAASLLIGLAGESPHTSLALVVGWRSIGALDLTERQAVYQELVVPGLREMIAARDLCPLLGRPHARLAAYAAGSRSEPGTTMVKSDPAVLYWARALRLAPYDADLYYFVGLSHFNAGRFDETWEAWRQSLVRSPNHVHEIVAAALPKIGVEGLLSKVMSNNPEALLKAARQLDNDPSRAADQRKILLRVRDLLTKELDLDEKGLHQLALTHRMLGEMSEALAAYRQAVDRAPQMSDWRIEYAELLYSQQTTATKREALEQLDVVLLRNPHHAQASNLRAVIMHELGIEKKSR